MQRPKTCDICDKDCKPEGIATGYAITSDQRILCYDCAATNERADMIEDGRAVLYHGDDKVTNWTGLLSFNCGPARKSRHNIARWRYDVWFIGPDKKQWHGVRYGDNTQILRCRRAK
jgi:hypothetical protein